MGVMKNMKNMKITAVIRIAFMLCSLYALGMMVIALAMVSGGVNLSEKSAAATGFQLAFLACVVGSLLTGVIVGNMVVKTIKYSMGQLQQMANALAVGDTSVTFEQTDNNELGAIVREFNSVVGATKKYSEEAYKIAEGDMTVNVEVRSDNDTLGKALKKLVTDNNNTLLGIRESSMQLTSGSGQVASASQALAQGSTEQASAIEQISASMTEIAKDINANAEVTNQSDVVVREMVARATKGNEQMKEMMKAMHAIQAASKNISKVIKTIDDIAFQTNILALNATVEAARAGVHGKGFAVVAEEVKNLAEKSAAAAQETAELIQSSIDKVQEGSQLAEGTAAALDQTVTDLEGCIEQIAAIASACSQQATAVAQINQALNQVSQVVQTNSATSEECASASEELSNQAVALRNMISKYKLTSANGRNLAYEQSFGNTSAQAYAANAESVISLDGNFGKY